MNDDNKAAIAWFVFVGIIFISIVAGATISDVSKNLNQCEVTQNVSR